jgi:hypothetical protein
VGVVVSDVVTLRLPDPAPAALDAPGE